MSIKEKAQKIKGLVSSFPEWEKDVFVGLLVVVVAVGAYGIGRLARLSQSNVPVRIENLEGTSQVANAVMSVKTEKSSSGTKLLEIEQGSVPQQASTPAGVVVGSKNGTKYHLPDCSGAKRIKPENLVTFDSVSEAERAGYTPAANCSGLN